MFRRERAGRKAHPCHVEPNEIVAVRAGLGLAVRPDFLATGEDLVQVLSPPDVISNDVWVVILSGSARVRAVTVFLAEAVAGSMRVFPFLSGGR